MQTFEQKAIALVGMAILWILLLIFLMRDGTWDMAVMMSIPFVPVTAALGFAVYQEWRIIAKGECFAGKLIAREPEYFLERQRKVKVEFFRNDVRYTVVVPMEPLQASSLTALDCTVYCLEHQGKLRCIVRDFQYNNKFDTVGILLPEQQLPMPEYLAFSDQELAERKEKQRTHADCADYTKLYK